MENTGYLEKLPGLRLGKTSKKRSAAAIFLSIGAHLVAFFAFFSSLSGQFISSPQVEAGGGVPAFYITLSVPNSAPPTSAQNQRVASLFAKFQTTPIANPLLASTQKLDRFRVLADRLKAGSGQGGGEEARRRGEASSGRDKSDQADKSPGKDAKTDDGKTADNASTGQLWGRIEPCWRNLGLRTRVSVKLEVKLDRFGQLRTPPKVLRSNAAILDEPRLKAEDGALAAVAACLPRGDLTFAGKIYTIEFPQL